MTDIAVNWFEIPVIDVERAAEFYATVLDRALTTMDGPDGPMQVFMGEDGPAGALIQSAEPVSAQGVLVYLNCPDIDAAIERVAAAGGEVEMARTSIGEYGYTAQFIDSEGNRIALHNLG